jgi:hypothetical protein
MKQGGRDLDRLASVEIAIRLYRPMHRLEAAASAIFSPRFRLSRIASSTTATDLAASAFLAPHSVAGEEGPMEALDHDVPRTSGKSEAS